MSFIRSILSKIGSFFTSSPKPAAPSAPSTSVNPVQVSPPQTGNSILGIDVSHYEGVIDWPKVFQAGYRFAILKATEGTSFVDPTFRTNYVNAKAAGLVVGAYHFFHPEKPIAAQAEFFASTIGNKVTKGDIFPTIDFETLSEISTTTAAINATNFVQALKSILGTKVIFYSYLDFLNHVTMPANGLGMMPPLWLACYKKSFTVPQPWVKWTILQTSETGSVPGINGNCDLDIFQGTMEEFKSQLTVQ